VQPDHHYATGLNLYDLFNLERERRENGRLHSLSSVVCIPPFGISWKDKMTNEIVREATALSKLEDIIRCRRPRWLGHLSRMECHSHRIPRQAHHWEPDGFRRRPGCPRQNWRGLISKDLKKIEIRWDELQEAAEDRKSWWIRVAQCVFDAR